MQDLSGKNVVITGGSYGMGKEMARAFVKEGSNVFVIARNKDKLDAAIQELGKDSIGSHKVLGYPADVTDREGITKTIDAIAAEQGGIDVLVNNAGIVIPGYVEELPVEAFETVLKTNYLGAVYTIKAALPHLLEKKKSAISITSSILGIKGIFGYATYAPTKFALIGLSEVLRSELKDRGVQVSVLLPPDTDTPGFEEEKKVRPYETDVIGGTAGLMSSEELARRYMVGFKKGKSLIMCETTGKFLFKMNGIWRGFVDFYLDRMVAKARRDKAKSR